MPTKTIFISCMQTIGILLVVMGHSFYLHGDHPLCMWIYSFHMPLFFFISGFLFAQSLLKRGMEIQEVSFWGRHGLFFSKFRRLLVPYLLISSLVYLPKVMLSFMAVRPVELSWSSYFSMLLYPYSNVIGSFWFLPTLYLVFVIFVGYGKYVGRNLLLFVPLLVLHLCSGISKETLLNLDGVCIYTLYFLIGYETRRRRLHEFLLPHCELTMVITFVLSWLLYALTDYYSYIYMNVFTSINGILLCLAVGFVYQKHQFHFFDHLFGSSYCIYIYSWFVQALLFQVFMRCFSLPLLPVALFSVVLGIYLPWCLYKWLHQGNKGLFKRFISLMSGD